MSEIDEELKGKAKPQIRGFHISTFLANIEAERQHRHRSKLHLSALQNTLSSLLCGGNLNWSYSLSTWKHYNFGLHGKLQKEIFAIVEKCKRTEIFWWFWEETRNCFHYPSTKKKIIIILKNMFRVLMTSTLISDQATARWLKDCIRSREFSQRFEGNSNISLNRVIVVRCRSANGWVWGKCGAFCSRLLQSVPSIFHEALRMELECHY